MDKTKVVQDCQYCGLPMEAGRLMKKYHPACRKLVYYHANKTKLNANRTSRSRETQQSTSERKPDGELTSQQIKDHDERMGFVDSTWLRGGRYDVDPASHEPSES